MRIQNNITAMNTHRMYTINNDNVAKSAEKLSSGYRINRAGDDAAGLAISEKMRAQIRGLNMATKNSQDAISLVQTAEGALQETHSMLQRMNELAVQAATGTNEGFDRTQAAKEFEQLKREINDVAEQTNFNNMKILDGSLSYEGYVRSAQTSGVNLTISDDSVSKLAGAAGKVVGVSTEATAATNGTAGTITAKVDPGAALTGLTGAAVGFEVTINGSVFKASANASAVTAAATDTWGTVIDSINTANSNAGLKLTNGTQEIWVTGDKTTGELTFTGQADATGKYAAIDLSSAKVSIVQGTAAAIAGGTGTAFGTAEVKETKNQVGATDATAAKTTIEFDLDSLKYGDTFKIGDTTYEVVETGKQPKTDGATGIAWNGKTNEESDFIKNLVDSVAGAAGTIDANDGSYSAAAGATATDVKATQPAGTVNKLVLESAAAPSGGTAEADAKTANEATTFTWLGQPKAEGADTSLNGRVNTVEFEISKMKDGDEFTINIGGTKGADGKVEGGKNVTIKYKEGTSRADFMNSVKDALQSDLGMTESELKNIGIEVKGNALIIKDDKVNISMAENTTLPQTNAMRIQVGANENEQLALSIDSMNTAGLGLDNAFLTISGQTTDQNIDSAGAAITAVKAAINKVSDQRATLGAMQNRLDHKIANLKVASENLSASESRIRDVDMASEMTNFTKNNILSQAATAMLAQANALPQNVLSLLG